MPPCVMSSSNSSLPAVSSKNASGQTQLPSPSQAQSGSSLIAESHAQRRSGGSGSFGSASTTRLSPAAPRNTQSLRKQHKGQRRPRLADEDAAAESVSHGHQAGYIAPRTWLMLAGRYAIHKAQRPDVHHPSHELRSATQTTKSFPLEQCTQQPPESDLGPWFGLSRS